MTCRTVAGDLPGARLGRVNYHEHLFQVSPLLPGDEITDAAKSQEEAARLLASGFEAMVDATPYGLGRKPAAVARISSRTGLHVIAATGAHREAHYADDHWLRGLSAAELTDLFTADVRTGMPAGETTHQEARGPRAVPAADGAAPVRSGIIKTGVGYWSISSFERAVLEAAAATHVGTGAPIMVHLEFCTAVHEVLDLLESAGARPQHVILAHADRDPDPILHAELAERGAFLGYDGVARPRSGSEYGLIALITRMIEAGRGDRILLGADVARRTRYTSYGGMPGLEYLGRRFIPRLEARIGAAAVRQMLVTNPATALSFTSTR